ncbi:MAG: hypothetical protein ACOY0T_23275 [Myxococcota bacterium]
MSEQKPKIDLKARLGKKTVATPAAGGSSIPPPMAATPSGMPSGVPAGVSRPSMPRPSGAPQVTPSGVPVPPFAAAPSRPAMDPSNPYGAMQPQAAAPAKPTAIRIEMGEEVMAAQRAGRKKVLFLAAIAFLVGGGVGFTAGGGAERAKGAEAAISGAQDLVKDITKSNAEVQKLADTLKSAKEKLSKGAFPEEEVSKLGGINIPFGGKNLSGKGIGRFKPEVVSMLIEYANGTTAANEQKEKVQNVLSGAKKGIVELLEQQSKPQVRWAALLSNGPNGPWASMLMLPAPFGAKDKWLDELKVGSGKEAQTFKRYSSGNPINNDSPYFVPVDPTSQGGVCPSDVIFKLRRELNDLESVLRGDNTPGVDRAGLIDQAQKLTVKLNQIGKES